MFKSQAFVTVILTLVVTGLLAGCASPATAEPTSAPAEPTDVSLPTPDAPTSQWEHISTVKTPATLRMGAFLDENLGIIGGPDRAGIAQTTTDGGQSWTVAGNSSMCLFGLDVIDAKTMWECNASNIRVTTDGGQSWSGKASGRGQPGCKISAVDEKTAFVTSPSELVVTHDGGLTREPLPLPADLTTSQVAAISFRSQTDGYILDGAGQVYATTDGGKTWETRPSPDLSQYGELKLRVNQGQPYAAMRFFDNEHGFLILSLAGGGASKVVALRTADGGKTWDEQIIEAFYSTLYLSRDGKYLTLASAFTNHELSIFRYIGD